MCTTTMSDLGLDECPICHAIVPEPEVRWTVTNVGSKTKWYSGRVVIDPHHDWHIERGDIEQ